MTYLSDSLVAMSQVETPLGEGVSIRHLAPAGSLRGDCSKTAPTPSARFHQTDAQGACDLERETSCRVCQG
jgi:hypothetical protein